MTTENGHGARHVDKGGSATDLQPTRIIEIETARPIPEIACAGPARLLIRQSGRPIGFIPVDIPPGGWSRHQVAAVVGPVVTDSTAVATRPAGSVGSRPASSVVVTTCHASEQLLVTLSNLRRQTVDPVEIILVDNRPATSEVAALLTREHLTDVVLVNEPRMGLSYARNAGLAAAKGDVVAFVDDDLVIDSTWLAFIMDAFVDDTVACVTGLVLPLELETVAQRWLEEFGGFSKGFRSRRFSLTTGQRHGALFPFAAGMFGTGANSAFRAEVLRRLGGFDEHLGTGTAARGGEDLDIYVSVVQAGFDLVYEPAALVRHRHHRDVAALHQQLFSYGIGLSAMLTKRIWTQPRERGQIMRLAFAGLRYLLDPRSPKNARKTRSYPPRLTCLEILGLLCGPFAYWLSRRAKRRMSYRR